MLSKLSRSFKENYLLSTWKLVFSQILRVQMHIFQNVRQISIIKLSIIAVEVIDNIFNNITHEHLVATRSFWKGLAKTIATPSVRACERQTRTPGISILTYPSQANFIWRVYVRARATVFRDTANMIMHVRA